MVSAKFLLNPLNWSQKSTLQSHIDWIEAKLQKFGHFPNTYVSNCKLDKLDSIQLIHKKTRMCIILWGFFLFFDLVSKQGLELFSQWVSTVYACIYLVWWGGSSCVPCPPHWRLHTCKCHCQKAVTVQSAVCLLLRRCASPETLSSLKKYKVQMYVSYCTWLCNGRFSLTCPCKCLLSCVHKRQFDSNVWNRSTINHLYQTT